VTAPILDLLNAGAMHLKDTRQPAVSGADFRDAMSMMASSVGVVTAAHEDEVRGRTATAVFSLSLEPPSILVSINITSRLADLIVKSRGFSLAILASDQQVIGDAFAGKFDDRLAGLDRFAFGVWGQWPSGNPLLYGAAVALDCELVGSIETQTHMLFAGGVIATEVAPAKTPLIWHRRGYAGLRE